MYSKPKTNLMCDQSKSQRCNDNWTLVVLGTYQKAFRIRLLKGGKKFNFFLERVTFLDYEFH